MFSRLITTLFSTLAPVYYPISLIPLPFRYLALPSPTTNTAHLVHGMAAFVEVTPEVMLLDFTVVLSITTVYQWIGVRKSRWREK